MTIDLHLATGVELVNMIMRVEVKEFDEHDQAQITVPTMLTQAQNVVDEANYFIFRGNNG